MQNIELRQAFTLLELSIVLVIIGLIVGGITVGADMIRAAELRAVITEHQRFQTAVHVFKDKYFSLPGDMTNAEAFWGTMATGTCPNATAGTGTQTCNGDGDGTIEPGSGGSQTGEMFLYWQHLANAGLIEGSYSGIAGSTNSTDAEIGNNVPPSKLTPAGWTMYSWATFTGNAELFNDTYNNVLVFGAEGGNITEVNILLPEEAWNLDKKIDDGLPAAGMLKVRRRVDCTTQSDGSAITTSAAHAALVDAVYNLSNTSNDCSLIFMSER